MARRDGDLHALGRASVVRGFDDGPWYSYQQFLRSSAEPEL